jgi:hypothetical protein
MFYDRSSQLARCAAVHRVEASAKMTPVTEAGGLQNLFDAHSGCFQQPPRFGQPELLQPPRRGTPNGGLKQMRESGGGEMRDRRQFIEGERLLAISSH